MNLRSRFPILVAGGGIGGLAAALALVRQGHQVKVLEQAPQLGEIGAGIQLGPNAFAAFDALGVGENVRARAVYTDELVMHDALDEHAGRPHSDAARFSRTLRQSVRGDPSGGSPRIAARGYPRVRAYRGADVNDRPARRASRAGRYGS